MTRAQRDLDQATLAAAIAYAQTFVDRGRERAIAEAYSRFDLHGHTWRSAIRHGLATRTEQPSRRKPRGRAEDANVREVDRAATLVPAPTTPAPDAEETRLARHILTGRGHHSKEPFDMPWVARRDDLLQDP